jgi:hypothetical protein
VSDLFQPAGNADPAYHALIIGVSRYPHLSGGTGPLTDEPLAAGLPQLRAAATSAVRVAAWIRDNLEHPTASKGSIRLLVSPSDTEVPLPHGITAPPATYENVSAAITAWRRDVRANADNLAILYIAGHGMQTGFGGGILLLEDFGAPNAPTPLHAAIDVESVRRGIVGDPNRPATATPKLQFYFYDACRINPEATAGYEALSAGIRLDGPRGAEAEASWVCFGARPKEYAFADPARRVTLYSQALIECLESRAPAEVDGRTVQFNELTSTLRRVVKDLGRQYGEEQRSTVGGDGDLDVAVHRRPEVAAGAGMPIPAWAPTFDVDSPLGQLRFVRISVHPQRPVSVRLAGNILASETRMLTDKPLELAVGNYEAVVPLPWGGEHVHGFVVTPGDSELVIDVKVPSDLPTAPPEVGLVPMPWYIRFFRWADGAFRLHESPPPLQSYTQSAGGNDLHRLTIRDLWTAPVLFQIESDVGQQSPIVALPIGGGHAPCEVYVGVGFDKVTAIARPGDEEVNTIAGYLNSGRADRAVMSMATTAEEMLREKMADPIGAIIGGYALLKLHELDRMHNWPNNLAEIFNLLPDGPVIAGVLAARRGDDEAAAGWFRTATRRGIPIFSEGLSLLAAESNALMQSQRGDALDIAEVARTAAALAPLADFSALCTTLHVHEHLMADVPPNAGWKQVGPPRGDSDRGWVDR